MKKFIPLALIASALGATAVYLKRNQQHVDRTLKALDELSETAEDTIAELAQEVQNEDH